MITTLKAVPPSVPYRLSAFVFAASSYILCYALHYCIVFFVVRIHWADRRHFFGAIFFSFLY